MRYLLLGIALALAGCGRPPSEKPPDLSIEGWKALPVEQKYKAETFERLKGDNPSLQTDDGWRAFERTILVPSRRLDLHQR